MPKVYAAAVLAAIMYFAVNKSVCTGMKIVMSPNENVLTLMFYFMCLCVLCILIWEILKRKIYNLL